MSNCSIGRMMSDFSLYSHNRDEPFSFINTRVSGVCTISATNYIGHKPYRPQLHRPHEKTISAKKNNHIGHNYIGHTKRPYRPKRITISATKMYCYLASIFISCQSETQNVICNPNSHERRVKEYNNCRHVSKCFDVSI